MYIYGWGDEGCEDGDGKEGIEIHAGWERREIAWPLVCRCGDVVSRRKT